VLFMLAPEVWRNHPEQPLSHFPAARALNDVLREAAALEGVEVIDMFEFAPPDWAGPDTAHFDRATYARAAARIAGVIGRYFGDSLAL
jgi:lysophospholipase L1-like esterase